MKYTSLTTIIAGMLIFSACEKPEFEGYTRAESGLNYKFIVHDEKGIKPTEGDGIGICYTIKVQSTDSLLVDSKFASQDGSGVTKFLMPKPSFVGSLEDAIMMMSKGDSASFIISADSFFLITNRMKELPKFLKAGDKLQANIKLVDVKSKAEIAENRKKQDEELKKMAEAEKPALDKYISDNKIAVTPTASGLYFIETKKGTGAKAKAGDEVTAQYKGTLLNGQEFDSSYGRPEPFKFALGQGQVIPGWDEAFQLMSKGGKAKLIIPSSLAYGAQGGGGVIPPFSPLVFEVELVDIASAK